MSLPISCVALLCSLLAAAPATVAQAPSSAAEQAPASVIDQAPDGLSTSDWSSIRAAYQANRHAARAVSGGLAVDGRLLSVDEQGANYSMTIDPVTQQAYLKASNPGSQDSFGNAVAVSGDTVVVGAWFEGSNATGVDGNQADNSAFKAGAAYVFVRTGATWSQQAYLKASNTESEDKFGYSVAVSGDTIVIGAHREWSSATGVNGNEADNGAAASGAAYVFVRSGTTWSQQAYLKASNTGGIDEFGFSVAVDGDTVVVGAYREGSNATGVNGDQSNNAFLVSGAAYVFTRSGTAWSQQAYLKASNTDAFDEFGSSVAVSGDTVVVGARFESSNATGVNGNQADNSVPSSGAAYVFVRSGSTWSQQAYLKASNPDKVDRFGHSIGLAGDTVVVGAPQENSIATGVNGDESDNSAPNAGAAYVFTRSGTIWSQQAYLKASNTGSVDEFGTSVAVSGSTVVVGAYLEDSNATGVNGDESDNSAAFSGSAYVFTRSGTAWSQAAYLKASNTDPGDQFGFSAAVSGGTIVVGAQREFSNATGANGNQADNSIPVSGAAYVFTLPEPWTELGGGTPGIAGTPSLTGTGSLIGGTPATMTLTNAPPSAAMLVWISFAPTPFAALSGTVHAFPYASQIFVFSNPAGSFSGATTWPVGVPPGTNVWFQFIVQDLSSVFDLTLSNGLLATTP